MQNEKPNETTTKQKEPKKSPTKCNPKSTSSLVLKKGQVMATVPQNLGDNFIRDLSPSDEEEVSEVESFILDQEELDDGEASRFLLSHDTIEGAEVRTVDPETQAKLEALLEAAGIGKLSTPDGKAYADPEVLRRLTSSVSCALDEAAAALTRMRAEQTEGATADSRSLAKACSNGDVGTVRQLLDEGGSVNETTEEGESLLSLACSAGYYELAQVLLAMRANVEDRGIKGDCTPLMEAASGGYVDIVKLLIVNGADVNAQSSAGNTPLHYAACGGHEEVVRALIESTANVEEHNENGHTPLMEASSAGHVGVAKILLEAGAGINTHSNEFKESALTLACYKGHLEMVKFLLEAGADQEHKTDEMHTALMEASMDGHVEVARLLLDHGAQVNMPADSFESPLTLAACGGHVDLANLLIERGANLEEVNDEGYTPLMEAAREGHEEMVVLLLAHEAYINAQTEETQETALTLACCGGFLDVAKFLIKAGADLELGCSTPLMEAAQEGHLELVRYLIQAGANVNAQTQTGDTALTYACENGHTEVVEVLLDEKCDIEHESEGGRTPLMKAARAGHYKTVQFLISRGADINKHTSTNDHTALSLASAGGHRAVVDLLLKHGSNPNHRLKDGSTMLIEAAKGGHTTVVNLLLDWPNNVQSPSPDLEQHSPPQSKVDISDMPRVPIHGLTNIVPPQDPDQVPASTNNLSTIPLTTGVSQVSGQVNLKDFNIQTKSIEQARPTMQKLITKAKLDSKSSVTTSNGICPQETVIEENMSSTMAAAEATTTPTSKPSVTAALNNNDPQKSTGNPKAKVMTETSSASIVDSCLSGSSSQVSEMGSDYGGESEQTQPEMATSSSTSSLIPFDSEDKMNEMMKASERLEAFISKMMRRAELLHTTSEEQSLQKQQILEELQKVEQELQEKAKNPLLLLNAQSKQEMMLDQSKMALLQEDLPFDDDEEECHQPYGMTLPVMICEANSEEVSVSNVVENPETDKEPCPLQMSARPAKDPAVILEADAHNVGTISHGGSEVKTAQLAKQESLSSASNASSSSADSGCGNSDFNGICIEGSEVDGPPVATRSDLVGKQHDDCSAGEDRSHLPETSFLDPATVSVSENDASARMSYDLLTSANPTQMPDNTTQNRPSSGESGSRASSEEVDLTNVIPVMDARDDSQIDKHLQVLHNHELLQQHVQEQLKAGTDPTKIALSLQQQLQHQQQQMLQQQQLTQLAQQCVQSYPLQLEPLVQQLPVPAVLSAKSVTTTTTTTNGTNSSCRELQLEHQRQQLQAQLELEQAKTKTLQAQLQLQKQIKTNNPQATVKYQQQLNVQQQTTVTCQTQLATSDLQQLKLQHLHQQLQLQTQQQLPANQQLSQQELIIQQQLQRRQQLLHQQHLQQQQQAVVAVTTTNQSGDQNSQVSTQTTAAATQLLSQQEVLQQQLHKVQHLQQMQQLAQQKHLGQYQGNGWPVATSTTTTATTANSNGQKKGKKKHQLLPQQQQQFVPQQLLVNNQMNMQFADYTTASTNTMATGTNSVYDYLELITPSPSTPVTPNPSPATPQISPPIYPAVELDAETESNHDTALTLACAGGHAELVSLLLSRGSDIEHRDKKGFTPLILAATAGHADVVDILLNHGAEIEAQSERTKDTPLSLACSGGRYEVVELLLNRGANKEHRNVSDYTPLSLAASGGYVNIIKLLLSHGAEINSRTGSKLGISPLMLAAMNGHTPAVKLLLDMGSDINAQIETNKNTALTLACFQGRHEVVSLLVDRRANIEHRAKTGLTPLMEAASGGYVEVGRVLLDKGADVNAPPVPSSRDTALTIAADKGHYRFVDLLLTRNAAIDVKNKKGNSPLWLACNGGHLDVVQRLVQAGADVDSQDNRKVSCLMAAFRKGHVKVIKWLVKHVTQFPSDQECLRYISTVTDQELLKKCHQCMEIIVSAKARQAAEANRNASILLEEIDAERSREESKKAAAARKREKKRKKKKEKQERERELEKKDQKEKVYPDGHSKSSSPEPASKEIDDDDDDDDDEEEEEITKKQTEPKSKKKNISDSTNNAAQLSRNARTSDSAGITVSSNVTNKNKKNQALASESLLSESQLQAHQKGSQSSVVAKSQPTKSNLSASSSVNTDGCSTNKPVASNSVASARGKSKRKQRDKERGIHSQDKDKENISDKNQGSGTAMTNTARESAKNNSNNLQSKAHGGGTSSKMYHNNRDSVEHNNTRSLIHSSGAGDAIGNGNIPNMKQSPRNIPKISNTGIGDLDDFGSLPVAPVKVTPMKDKEKKTPDKMRLPMDTYSVLSPAKTNALKSPGGPNVGKRGQKKDEGWKEVIRKSKKVTVASSAISRVIGRNGCNINAIREVSGAHIEIDKARSSGDRNITIRGSADATRQAHNLIMALIKDPDKELEQIIPKLKNRVVGTNTLTLSTSVWHNSLINGIPQTLQSSTTLTTTVISTVTTTLVAAQKGSMPKMTTAVTKAAGSVTLVTTTLSESVPNKGTTVTSSGARPQMNPLSNIGVFHAPIGVWNASMAQTSPAPGNNHQLTVSTPQSVQARRQLFPGDRQASLASSVTPANKPATYSSPSMAKTKVVNAASPGVSCREMKDTNSSSCGSFARDSLISSQSVSGSPSRPLQSSVPYPNKEPLPIKASVGSGSLCNKSLSSSQAEFYSPFNNTFSPFAERVLGKKEEAEGKMNFASVAAAGVIPTIASTPPMPQGPTTSQQGRDLDPSLQAKAPGYKAPGAQRTTSPLINDPDMAARAPGYRIGPPDMDVGRLPTYKPAPFMGISESDVSSLPNEYSQYVMQKVQQVAEQQKEMLHVPQMADSMSPHSASSTPAGIQSPHQPVLPTASTFRDEYTTPDQPMTLPKIESNLNPNAPDFTFRLQANQQLQRQLLAAQIFVQQQQQQQQQQHQQQSFNALGTVTSNASNSLPFLPPNMRLPPPFVLGQHGLVDLSASGVGQSLPDSVSQMGGFGAGGSFHSMGSSGLGDSGSSGLSPGNRQFSPMPPNAARSESVASSVGTSSKGESSPVPHVSGESSPHSSSAPSPTGHLPQYMDENLQSSQQQASLRPIGTGRTTKKDRCTQPYGEIADPSSASHLWGMAPDMEMSHEWMMGNPSAVGSNSSRMSHGLPSDMDENHHGLPPGGILPSLMRLEASGMLDHPAVESPSLHNPPLMVSNGGGTLFAGGVATRSAGPMPMSKVYPPVDGMQNSVGLSTGAVSGSGVGLPGDNLGNVWTQPPPSSGHLSLGSTESGESDPKSMWDNWTIPSNI